jgi:PRTRC genetic system protein A
MKHPDPRLFTPIYVKSASDEQLPEDESAYYVLSSEGLFLCRNHAFFTSCVRTNGWPTELAPHTESVSLRYPRVPQKQLERIVGFFAHMGEAHGAEAAALFLWDAKDKRMRFQIPQQRATVSESWSGRCYPSDLHYDMPVNLPSHLTVVGDIHSHVDAPAYASTTDRLDEAHRPGIHLVVGKIYREPPELHCEFVVDGVRFEVLPSAVIEGYEKRNMRVRQDWIDRVEVEVLSSSSKDAHSWNAGGNGGAYGYGGSTYGSTDGSTYGSTYDGYGAAANDIPARADYDSSARYASGDGTRRDRHRDGGDDAAPQAEGHAL